MKSSILYLVILFALLFATCTKIDLRDSHYEKGQIVHTVIFNLNDDITDVDRNYFIDQLKSLSKVRETKDLFVASYTLTNDERAKSNYDIILQMKFSSTADLYAYSNHEFHLDIRSKIAHLVAEKPLVYDYMVE